MTSVTLLLGWDFVDGVIFGISFLLIIGGLGYWMYEYWFKDGGDW